MKRKILSFILVLLMFPTACIFAACGKNGGYNLSKLSNDYYSIAESDGDNIIKQNNSILFDYSKHEQDGEKFLTKIINTVKPYSSINDYNKIYYNLMEFSNAYINACSNNNVGVEKDVKNSLKSKLDGLNSALKDVNIGIDLLANILEITPQDEVSTNISCLQRLEFVISSYESLFKKAIDFTYELENIYFNHVLINSNPNIYNISQNDFDANIVINNLKSRILWQKSNLTKIFIETYVCDSGLTESIKQGVEVDFTINGYKLDIETLSQNFTEENAALVFNNNDNKTNFYNLSIKAYNAHIAIGNDAAKFIDACNKIKYAKSNSEMTYVDVVLKSSIDGFNQLLKDYQSVLENMLKLL